MKRGAGAAGLAAPGLLLLAVFFLGPVLGLIWSSFGTKAGTFANYARIWQEPIYLQVLQRTMVMSAITALLCLVIGYPVAYRLATASPRGKAILLALIFVPFWTNLLVRSYGWLVMLNPRGVINTVLVDYGIVEQPLALVHNTTGALIGMTQIMLPYMILPLAAVMARIDPVYMRAARSLGARPAMVFLKVYLPLTLPGMMAGLVLVFTISLGFFVVPALLGGQREIFLAQLIEFNINMALNWGFAAALATLLLVSTLGLFWIGERWFKLGAIWGLR